MHRLQDSIGTGLERKMNVLGEFRQFRECVD